MKINNTLHPQKIGLSEKTGGALLGVAHLEQSIKNIFDTELKSRCKRRDYGSTLWDRIDNKSTKNNLLSIYAELAEIIDKWEPRFNLKKLHLKEADSGQFIYQLAGDYLGKHIEVTA